MEDQNDDRTITQQHMIELADRVDDIANKMRSSKHVARMMLGHITGRSRKKITSDAKMEYLIALAVCGRKGDASVYSSITPMQISEMRKKDKEFRELEECAIEHYRDKVRRAIEEEAIDGRLEPIVLKNADGSERIEGWQRKRNPTMMRLAARLFLPEYEERVNVSGSVNVNVGVLAIPSESLNAREWEKEHANEKIIEKVLTLDEETDIIQKSEG